MRKRFLQGLALLTLTAVLFFSPLYRLLAIPLVLCDPLTRADAIVVLGGGVNEWGYPTESTIERVHYGVGLYREGFAPRLVLSTGITDGLNESRTMRHVARLLGVPARDILLEEESRNTYENILFVDRLLQRNGWTHPIVVSSPTHMRRIALVWRKVRPGISPLYAPVRPSLFTRDGPWLHRLQQILTVFREYAALGWYWMKGRVG